MKGLGEGEKMGQKWSLAESPRNEGRDWRAAPVSSLLQGWGEYWRDRDEEEAEWKSPTWDQVRCDHCTLWIIFKIEFSLCC